MLLKKTYALFLYCFLLALTFCKNKSEEKIEIEAPIAIEELPKKLKIPLVDSESDTLGYVVFKEFNASVTLTAIISGISPGNHEMYILKTKNNTLYTDTNNQDTWNPKSNSYKGFIGNLIADENGDGTISKISNDWCMGCNDETKNILGKTVVAFSEKTKTDFVDIGETSYLGKIE